MRHKMGALEKQLKERLRKAAVDFPRNRIDPWMDELLTAAVTRIEELEQHNQILQRRIMEMRDELRTKA
jgi:hypothetical protein